MNIFFSNFFFKNVFFKLNFYFSKKAKIVTLCHHLGKARVELYSSDQGMKLLDCIPVLAAWMLPCVTPSDQGMKLLDEVSSTSDINRYRVFDVLIDSIMISDQALDFCNHGGLTDKMLEVCQV